MTPPTRQTPAGEGKDTSTSAPGASAPDEGSGDGRRDQLAAAPPRRRRWGVTVLVVAALAAAAVGTWWWQSDSASGSDAPSDASDGQPAEPVTPTTTATVRRRDLASTTTVAGTLTHRGDRDVLAGGPGTVTALPQVGDVITAGERLYQVDGQPVVLLPGDVPMWRDFEPGMDDGVDVEQLERALTDLGYAEDVDLTVDHDYTDVTAEVVDDFREDVGLGDGDGLARSEMVFVAGPVRVAELTVQLGAQVSPGTPVLSGTSPERIVAVELETADQDLLAEGDHIEVELPDGEVVDATVDTVAPVARAVTESGPQGETTTHVIDVELVLSGGEGFDEAPVDVEVVDQVAEDVLAVPVETLLALAEGGYALEVVTDDGANLVPVEIGGFSDGWVSVSGPQLEAGMEVVSA